MPDYFEMSTNHLFPKDLDFHGIILPLQQHERYAAMDANGQIWAYSRPPLWSGLASKWIPQDGDTPRLIVTYSGDQINAKLSIKSI